MQYPCTVVDSKDDMFASMSPLQGFLFAGTQFGHECWCGNDYGKYGQSSLCDYPCSGNPHQTHALTLTSPHAMTRP